VTDRGPNADHSGAATRTAENILHDVLRRRPWVGRESPVSSVDDAVTRAILGRGAVTIIFAAPTVGSFTDRMGTGTVGAC
jgi:hypothetical protein